MAAFVAKQMVGNKLSAVKGKELVRYCAVVARELCNNFNEVQECAEVPARAHNLPSCVFIMGDATL